MPHAAALTAPQCIDLLIRRGRTLHRIAGLTRVTVPVVRAWHAGGADPSEAAFLRLIAVARTVAALVPFQEEESPVSPPRSAMSAAEARQAIAVLERAGVGPARISDCLGVGRQTVMSWRRGAHGADAKRGAALRALLSGRAQRHWYLGTGGVPAERPHYFCGNAQG
jgi:hypothetical protein